MIQIVKITIKDYNSSQSAGKRKALPNRPSVSHKKEQQKKRKNRTKKKKTADKGIILFEMDELSSWVFSSKEAKRLESTIRHRLTRSAKIASRVRKDAEILLYTQQAKNKRTISKF